MKTVEHCFTLQQQKAHTSREKVWTFKIRGDLWKKEVTSEVARNDLSHATPAATSTKLCEEQEVLAVVRIQKSSRMILLSNITFTVLPQLRFKSHPMVLPFKLNFH
jgi:hypothetical protein